MTKVDAADMLNGRLDCARCHASHSWVPTTRPMVRQYSSIHWLRCTHCGERAVAKVVGGRYSSEAALVHARKEYEALCKLQVAFPQDEHYGTLIPIGHLEYAGHGIVVTKLFPGRDLMRHARTLDAAGTQAACHSAGVWLKKLHASDPQDRLKHLGVANKISFLTDTYRTVLHRDPKTREALELFVRCGADVDALPVHAVRQHGDFKPDNMLCDGTRYMGLDIRWRSIGAAAYDLAPFLNHLWLEGHVLARSRTGRRYDRAEKAFLAGYGDVGDVRALRWVQLYFALCYMGEYRLRGRLASSYAKWKAWPLVHKLATQLQEVA